MQCLLKSDLLNRMSCTVVTSMSPKNVAYCASGKAVLRSHRSVHHELDVCEVVAALFSPKVWVGCFGKSSV